MPGDFDPIHHPGNEALFRALDLSILSSFIGLPLHVHAEGLRGTGKTTIMRSVRRRLPLIQRIKGCIFNCLPWAPHCPQHRDLDPARVRAIGTEWVPMPFREISHSAKVGTVAGSIDLSRIADRGHPEVALLPGTLPQAHRGIIFVDEINRLADTAPELADILLDVMGTKPGRLQVEETGLPSVDLPVTVSVWAASNPDEDPGPLEDIRKQLSDRFDFVIAMERPSSVVMVQEILRSSREKHLALAEVPEWFQGAATSPGAGELEVSPAAVDAEFSGELGVAVGDSPGDASAALLGPRPGPSLDDWSSLAQAARSVECPPPVDELVASLYIDFGLESLRGVEAIHHGARMNCVLEGRSAMTFGDVAAIAPGALQHRLDVSTFARVMDYLAQRARNQGGAEAEALTEVAGAPGPAAAGQTPGGGPGESPSPFTRGAAGRAPGEAVGGSGADEPSAGPGAGDEHSREPASGWQSLWSIFGRRRFPEPGCAPGQSRPGAESAPGASSDGSSGGGPGTGQSSSGSAPRSSGQGGSGAPGRPRERDDPAVAPLHAARPLADILRDMELGGLEPPVPRVP